MRPCELRLNLRQGNDYSGIVVRIKKYQAQYNQGEDNADGLYRILNKWIEQHIACEEVGCIKHRSCVLDFHYSKSRCAKITLLIDINKIFT